MPFIVRRVRVEPSIRVMVPPPPGPPGPPRGPQGPPLGPCPPPPGPRPGPGGPGRPGAVEEEDGAGLVELEVRGARDVDEVVDEEPVALAIPVTPAKPAPAAMPPIRTRRVVRARGRASRLGLGLVDEVSFMALNLGTPAERSPGIG
ncbi:MAG: hypothetical protein ACRD0L_17870 [Acidimicrobiales bacterium]